MSLREREEVVPNALRVPVVCRDIVTFGAVGGKTCLCVIWTGRAVVVFRMTIHACIAQPVESQDGFGCVTGIAVCTRMCSCEREAILLVQSENIIHLPVVGVSDGRAKTWLCRGPEASLLDQQADIQPISAGIFPSLPGYGMTHSPFSLPRRAAIAPLPLLRKQKG